MSFNIYNATDGSVYIDATGGNYNLWGAENKQNTFVIGTGNDHIYGGNQGDEIYLNSGNDVVTAGNGSNDIYAGSGSDIIYGGSGEDWIHVGTGKDIMFGHGGSNIFDFSQGGHGGLTSATADIIADFNMDDKGTFDMIVANQSVVSRGVFVIDSNVTSIEQAEHQAQAADNGHNYGAVWVANHTTGTGYLLMDSNGDHTFETAVIMPGAVNHVTDAQAHNMLLPDHI